MKTIKDIAALSGFSIGTVSRVINNHPDVSEQAREVILSIIEQEGYQPNSNARLLKKNSGSSINILVKGTKNLFFEGLLEMIEKQFKDNGEEVSVVFLDETDNEVQMALQICIERKPKGLIFLGGNIDFFAQQFEKIKVPSVLVSGDASFLPFDNLSSYCTDDYQGGRDAVKLLLDHGHRRIGIVGGQLLGQNGQVGTARLQGAIDILNENNVYFDVSKQFKPGRFSMESGYEATKDLMEANPDLTGIFALSDTLAIGAIRALKDLGKSVPDDISVIGYDGIPYSQYSVPRITTIQQNSQLMAKKSVEDLLLRINYSRVCVHELIGHDVIMGDSIKSVS